MSPHKTPKIVIFSGNGKIGSNVAVECVAEMEKHGHFANEGHFANICLVGRNPDALAGVLSEIRTKTRDYRNVNVAKVFTTKGPDGVSKPNFVTWDEKKPELGAEQYESADVAVIPGGAAREEQKDKSFPDRVDLLDENLPMVRKMVRALVKGGFDIRTKKILLTTNPLDEITQYAEQVAREAWMEKAGNKLEDLPPIIAMGMGGTIDEARYHYHLQDEINAALEKAGKDNAHIFSAADIEAHVLGPHSDKMYFNEKSIKIISGDQAIPLDQFLAKHGISDQLANILKTAKELSSKEGMAINTSLGRSTYYPAAKRNAEIIAALLWGDQHELTASVTHEFNGQVASSGARINVSKKGAEVNEDWKKAALEDPELVKGVTEPRAAIPKNIQEALEREKIVSELKELLKGAKANFSIFPEDKKIELRGPKKLPGEGEMREVNITGVKTEDMETIKGHLNKLLRLTYNDKLPFKGEAKVDVEYLRVPILNDIKFSKLEKALQQAGIKMESGISEKFRV